MKSKDKCDIVGIKGMYSGPVRRTASSEWQWMVQM